MGPNSFQNLGKKMMSDSKFFMGYSRFDDEKESYETWEESVNRVMNMHRDFYKDKVANKILNLTFFSSNKNLHQNVLG